MSRLAAPDAAAALGVDTETLATWRARFGFPAPYSEQDRDYYLASDIEALREAVRSEHSLPLAIEAARRRAGVPPTD
jgi:MerR HTH family regulatory protein